MQQKYHIVPAGTLVSELELDFDWEAERLFCDGAYIRGQVLITETGAGRFSVRVETEDEVMIVSPEMMSDFDGYQSRGWQSLTRSHSRGAVFIERHDGRLELMCTSDMPQG